MKSNSAIYFFSLFPVFNPEETPNFSTMDKENSIHFYKSLLFNFIENAGKLSPRVSVVYCFDKTDEDFLPAEITRGSAQTFFGDTSDKINYLKSLADKHFNEYNKNLLVFGNSIGISSGKFKKFIDLLAIEDNAIVIGKAPPDKVAFFGFNNFNTDLFSEINWTDINYENILIETCKHDNFIYSINNFLTVNDNSDFKKLYDELSKKDSLEYCSQEMHERFTHLFIEYKDLLK